AAVAFRDLAPWRWTSEADLFGVEGPESGQTGYCCVMGGAGEHFALGVYLGSEGLAGLWRLREAGEIGAYDPGEVLSWQNCLMASFEDRNLLRQPDLETIRALGLKFRGRGAWPLLRRYLPGYAPWYLTAPASRFLTAAPEQARDVTR